MPNHKRTLLALGLMLAGSNLAAAGDWKLKGEFDAAWRYDTNIFNLSASQITSLGTPSDADIANGHYRDMVSGSDHIVRPQFSLALHGPGLFGKRLEIKGSVGYDVYARSSRRSNFEAALSLRQSLGKRGAVQLTGRYLPRYFRKNFLLDGSAGSNGQVLPEDRIYAAGVYEEAALGIDFDYRVLSRKQTGAFGVTVELGALYADRRYEALFPGRDRQTLELAGGLALDFRKGTELLFRYTREDADSPVTTEVLLLDEPDYGIDFNDDGDQQDYDIRMLESVDRSFKADVFAARLSFELSRTTTLELRGSRILRRYSSQQPYDGYAGRTNKRWIARADLDHRISSHVSFIAGYVYDTQKINRVDVTEDESDYAGHVIRAGFGFRF